VPALSLGYLRAMGPWSPSSWRARPARQQPTYPDAAALAAVEARLRNSAPVVRVEDCIRAREALGDQHRFLLQGGDCAEQFDDPVDERVTALSALFDAMLARLGRGADEPIAVARIAGQFAKPRSDGTERRGGIALPAYRGDIVNDARFEAARANELQGLHQLNPAIASMHHDPPDMPVECLVTMAQHFVSLSLPAIFPLPSYARWVLSADHGPVYRWHERVLRLLQSGGVRGRWQLKSPHHAIALEALTARYPDARFIVTHRDPATCVASAASLAREFARTFAAPRGDAEFGELWTEILAAMGDGIVQFRREHGDDRFFDVPYRDLTGDPIGTVQRLYERLGDAFTSGTEAALRAHVEVAKQHRFGRHEYGLAEFELDRPSVDARFADYRERFAEFL